MRKFQAGDILVNPIFGWHLKLISLPEANGGLKYEAEYDHEPFKGKGVVPEHMHPQITETFEILSGRARYRLGGQEHMAEAGETVLLPAGVPHMHPWSDSDQPLRMKLTATVPTPDAALLNRIINAVITGIGLANASKTGPDGRPALLQAAVIARYARPGVYLGGMPIAAQDVLLSVLGTLGEWRGYRAVYEEYGSV